MTAGRPLSCPRLFSFTGEILLIQLTNINFNPIYERSVSLLIINVVPVNNNCDYRRGNDINIVIVGLPGVMD